tara:strand:+ start:271 stop:492 length:222 start_codon:yes stop_codon:yes gene_type:complete
MNTTLHANDKVKFLGCTVEQQRWGNNDFPPCIVGRIYTVTAVEVRSQHTKVSLEGIVGKFNSVSFVLVNPNDV